MEQEQMDPQPAGKKAGMNYAIMGIVVAIVVIVGIVAFAKSRKSSQPGANKPAANSEQKSDSPAAKQADAVVKFDGTAFSPQNVTIKAGQTVEFKNESTTGMWVASAPHPTHTDYPGFDAKRAYGQGESYKFTFDKVGTWKYHIHETPPSKFGSVTVQ